MREVIVNAFPKSGVTWLVHLICDLLEGIHRDTEKMKPQSYDHPVTSDWIIRKNHYPYWSQAIPILKGKKVIFTQRDPRDVVVSAMFYRKAPGLDKAIDVLVSSDYVGWLESWLEPSQSLKCKLVMYTSYEAIQFDPIKELRGIIEELTGDWQTDDRINLALDRQSFDNMTHQLGGDTHFMRKGIVGDWRNHFTRSQAERFNEHFGEFMLRQGYVDDLEWWRDV